jgi:SAM-dependent methyltransferase
MLTDPLIVLANSLVCPVHHVPLNFRDSVCWTKGVPFSDGPILCARGCRYAIKNGIPRFVADDNYAVAFGRQWQTYRSIQLDSYIGQPVSRQRLERCLGIPLRALAGKTVLECGSGAGRFTELLISNCGLVVSLDISGAVEANLKNCAGKEPYFLCQADVNVSPLPHHFFDVVICLGVIQHTPCPEQTIANLAAHVAPGGLLVIDHYTHGSRLGAWGERLTLGYPLRAVLRRLSRVRPDLGLKVTKALTAACDPIRRRTCQFPWLDSLTSRLLLPSICYYRDYPLLPNEVIYKWNELDTHDMLTDWYKHFRSPAQLSRCLEALGLEDVRCELNGNGVEARARAPAQWSESTSRAAGGEVSWGSGSRHL